MSAAAEGKAPVLPPAIPANDWLRALRRYIAAVALANLVWEFGHMPLYTLWETGTASEISFAALHCTGGDILISLASVMLALFLAGQPAWPRLDSRRVIDTTASLGLSYTLFSAWRNIEVRRTVERRVGKEGVRRCRNRGAQDN